MTLDCGFLLKCMICVRHAQNNPVHSKKNSHWEQGTDHRRLSFMCLHRLLGSCICRSTNLAHTRSRFCHRSWQLGDFNSSICARAGENVPAFGDTLGEQIDCFGERSGKTPQTSGERKQKVTGFPPNLPEKRQICQLCRLQRTLLISLGVPAKQLNLQGQTSPQAPPHPCQRMFTAKSGDRNHACDCGDLS